MDCQEVIEKIKNVNALITEKEKEVLCKYARKIPDNGTILEIGTAAGSSAFTLVLSSKPSVKTYTIDPNINETFIARKKEWGLDKRLIFINKTSEEAAKDWRGEIDLLFIDGIHSYPGVTNDYNWFSPFVKKGGIVIFHDYFLYGNTVGKAIDDISKDRVEKIEIIDSFFRGKVRTGMFIARKR